MFRKLKKSGRGIVLLLLVINLALLTLLCARQSTGTDHGRIIGTHYQGLADVSPGEQLNHIDLQETKNMTPLSFGAPAETAWQKHPHLVVMGIPSTDKQKFRDLRNYQRETWFTFPEVARSANNFKGLMLPLYFAALTELTPPYFSPEMATEMRTWSDTLMLRIHEEPPTNRIKQAGKWGYYGLAFHVSNARKVHLWMRYAYNTFPETPFIAKGDDDSFIFVPEYLRALQQLPRMATLYGHLLETREKEVPYLGGMAYTFTRDIPRALMDLDLAVEFISRPFDVRRIKEYKHLRFLNEDWTLGKQLAVLFEEGLRRMPEGWESPDFNIPISVPPPVGWGKLYNEYIRPNSTVPQKGVVPALADGTPAANHSFPRTPNPMRIIYVADNRRVTNGQNPSQSKPLIVAHHVYTREQFRKFFVASKEGGPTLMWHPTNYMMSYGWLKYFYVIRIWR